MKMKLCALMVFAMPCAFAQQNDTWVDVQHQNTRNTLKSWAHSMDDWFGEPDPNQPASANLRVMLDTNWDKYDGVRVKPRVRGRVKLPVLERKVSVVFGDDDLDHEIVNSSRDELNRPIVYNNDKWLNARSSRNENASLALRWSNISKKQGIDTDADIGVRSGDDVYLRLKASKTWEHGQHYATKLEQMYRYGLDSKHFARSSMEVKRAQADDVFVANYVHADYVDNDDEKGWSWGNSLYRQHNLSGNRRLNYGVQAGGALSGDGHRLNSYGLFASWRQPVWRDWLFVQPEVHYANNRDEDRKHYPSVLFRLEAIF